MCAVARLLLSQALHPGPWACSVLISLGCAGSFVRGFLPAASRVSPLVVVLGFLATVAPPCVERGLPGVLAAVAAACGLLGSRAQAS